MTSPPTLPDTPLGPPGENGCAGTPLSIPDVTGLSTGEAALAYAEAGWYVLPVREGTKHPGSVVYGRWQDKSSRDPAQIDRWWKADPNYGIALHVGKSGAGVFDFDGDDLRVMIANGHGDLMDALESAGAIQGTRAEGDRGHYVFLVPDDGREYGNSAGVFGQYGEFRGRNGVIIVAPTAHPDAATKGGMYGWRRVGPLAVMPEALQRCLSAPSDTARAELLDSEVNAWIAGQPGAEMEPEELAALPEREWLSEYATAEMVRELLFVKADGGSIYDAARNTAKHMIFAAQEGRKGLVLAVNNLWDAYTGLMADRQAGLLDGEVRPTAVAEAELAPGIRGAVALAVERDKRYDMTAWANRLAEKAEAAPVAGPRWRPRVTARVMPRVSRRYVR